jgi:hypothetical protein
MVFVPLFRPACIMSFVLRWSLAFVLLLVNVAFLPMMIAFLPAMLCSRKYRCAQQ